MTWTSLGRAVRHVMDKLCEHRAAGTAATPVAPPPVASPLPLPTRPGLRIVEGNSDWLRHLPPCEAEPQHGDK